MRKNLLTNLLFILCILSFVYASPAQWSVSEGGNGHFYEVVAVPEGLTWPQANSAAGLRGGYLATITSPEENDFVFNQINYTVYWNESRGPWIGGYQADGSVEPDGGWQWISGEPFVYTNWSPGQPNNSNGHEKCLHFGWGETTVCSTWNDQPDGFNGIHAYMVEYELVVWRVSEGGNGHVYLAVAVPEGISWEDARTASEHAGGYLATITSEEENAFVFSLIEMDMYWGYQDGDWRVGPWIGAFQEEGSAEPDDGWRWITGEPFEYANWMDGQPNNNPRYAPENENVINFGHAKAMVNTWNDRRDYSEVFAYVIEYEPVIPGPVEWFASQGGNNHLYEVVLVPEGISWTQARLQAEQAGGYLATITTSEENDFVFRLIKNEMLWTQFVSGSVWIGGPWIGGFQAEGSLEPDGGWGWVTGERFSYSAWTVGNPDNITIGDCINQTNIHYMSKDFPGPTWNDQWDNCLGYLPISYVIEYSDPYCFENVPGDANNDCVVNFEDLVILSSHWLECNLIPISACP